MDTELVVKTLRSLEDGRAVTATCLASALGSDLASVQAVLDDLVRIGELATSELSARRNEGYDFKIRAVWYHTPDREVTARFGSVLSMDGARHRRPTPAPVTLAS